MLLANKSQADFYREFLMARGDFDPRDYGVDMDRTAFTDQMVDFFGVTYKGQIAIDELLLRPSEALRFISDVKRTYGYFDMPEDLILRVILNRRKHG